TRHQAPHSPNATQPCDSPQDAQMFPARDLLIELKPSIAELRAIDLRSSHQFEEEIGNASSANGLLFHKMEFSVVLQKMRPTSKSKAGISRVDIQMQVRFVSNLFGIAA